MVGQANRGRVRLALEGWRDTNDHGYPLAPNLHLEPWRDRLGQSKHHKVASRVTCGRHVVQPARFADPRQPC